MNEHEHVIALVKKLSIGPCSCMYENGSASSGYYDPNTGVFVQGHSNSGPKTECVRCKARAALEADGTAYVKDDRPNWAAYGFPSRLDPNAACAVPMSLGEVTIVTGSAWGLVL